MTNMPLSLDQAPPYAVPLRFFFTAPLFGAAAALLLFWYGPAALATRWTPAVLAITHFMTLGFAVMVMSGALLQLLPVLVGAHVARPRAVSAVVHGLLSLGVLMLGMAFLSGRHSLYVVAVLLLVGALAVLLTVTGVALRRRVATQPTARVITHALLALLVTLLLGAYLALLRAGVLMTGTHSLTAAHLTWGLLGWVGLLVMAVAYQVVPMFQMTPEYPAPITRWLSRVVLLLLVLWSVLACGVDGPNRRVVLTGLAGLLGLSYAVFALSTLWLQQRRRRRLPDVTLWFWRLGMVLLLVSIGIWLIGGFIPQWAEQTAYPVLLGVLMIAGFTVAVISGMLYKIVPFLGWLHLHASLHSRAERRTRLPNMKDFIPERAARRQFYVYLLALCLLTGAALRPVWFTYPAALTWLLSCGLLWLNIFNAVRLYRRLSQG